MSLEWRRGQQRKIHSAIFRILGNVDRAGVPIFYGANSVVRALGKTCIRNVSRSSFLMAVARSI